MSIEQGPPDRLPTDPVSAKSTSRSAGGTATVAGSVKRRSTAKIWAIAMLCLVLLVAVGTMAAAPYWAPYLLPHMGWGPAPTEEAAEPTPLPVAPAQTPPAPAVPSNDQNHVDQTANHSGDHPGDHSSDAAQSLPPEAVRTLGEDQRKLAVDVSNLATRLDKIETTLQGVGDRTHLARILLLANGQLQEAIARASGYAPQLAVLKALSGDDPALQPIVDKLQPHAQGGVRSIVVLAQHLDVLAGGIDAPDEATDQSWWEAAMDRTRHLIAVRRIIDPDHPENTPAGPTRIVALATADLRGNDLPAAIDQMNHLQGLPAERAKPWLDEAQARLDVEQASSELQTLLIQRLAPDKATAPADGKP